MKRRFLWCVVALAALVGTIPISSATDPALVGQWSSVISWPAVAIHAHLLNTGKVLTWQDGATATVWNPQTGTFTAVPNSFTDLLCVGHNFLPDGRFITIGGEGLGPAVTDVNIFDPQTLKWTQAQPMSYPRWYPTAIVRPNGQVMAISGSMSTPTDLAPTPESYDPSTDKWTTMTEATKIVPYYPFTFILPDGRLFASGASEQAYASQVYDFTTHVWSAVDPTAYDGATAVMYEPGKILKVGSASDGGFPADPSSAAAYVIDMNQPNPMWRQVASMAFPRAFANLTALPDGSVLVTGGGKTKDGQKLANGVLPAELWSPATELWTTMASMATPRLYHSEALLLPDGRVFVGGSGGDTGVIDEKNVEIYSPPYLFKGARPVISSAPSTLSYGNTFTITTPDAGSISAVRLMALGSVTHGFNMNQHVVSLSFVQSAGSITVTAPANINLATPGYYMLFLVNSTGVPSVASMVSLPLAAAPPPPPGPTNLIATATNPDVSLIWTAPSSGVVSTYSIYRSTTSGFVPGASNFIGQSATTNYVDSNPGAGTYFYRVIATVGGLASVASNEASATVTIPSGVLAVDKVVAVDGAGARTTAAFSTSVSGELLLAFVASDGPSPGTQTMTVSGAGLTWSLVRRTNTQAGTSEIWKATAAATLNNVTVTSTPASGSFLQSLTVVAFAGSSGVGASAGANAATGAPSVTVTTTQQGSLIYGVGNDWDKAIARTPGTGQAILRQYLAASGDTFWFQNRTSTSAGSGLQLQLNDTAPTTDRWNLTAVEILPSGPPPPPVAVPDVVNLTQAAATTAITSAGLTLGTVTTASSSTVAAGLVISESPVSGTLVAPGSPVSLVVSSGPAPVAVPNVVNMTQANAQSAIVGAGLTVGVVTSASSTTVAIGSVISESPSAGTLVAPGSSVSLVVSTGPPPPVVVPNVVNMTQANASSAITSAGLVVGTVTTASSATVPAGLVISQNPAGGVSVPAGSAVALVISTGPAPSGPVVDNSASSDGSGTRSVASFNTTTAGDVIVAFAGADGPTTTAQTLTVAGGGLSWTLVRRVNAQRGVSEIWAATAANPLVNATITATASKAGYHQSLTVVAFAGAAGVGTSATASASSGAPAVSLTTSKAGSLVFGVGNDWDNAIARVPAANQTLFHQWVDTSTGDTYWVQSLNAPVATSPTLVQLSDTAPTTDRWNFAAVEITSK